MMLFGPVHNSHVRIAETYENTVASECRRARIALASLGMFFGRRKNDTLAAV